MLVPSRDYAPAYEALKTELHQSNEKKVLVFVATTCCDSVCTVKILQVTAVWASEMPAGFKQVEVNTLATLLLPTYHRAPLCSFLADAVPQGQHPLCNLSC